VNAREHSIRFLARCLGAGQGTVSEALGRELSEGRVDWRRVAALAGAHSLTPALWRALQDRRLVGALPQEVTEFLQQVHGLNHERNLALQAQLGELVRALNAAGIEPLLLKGAVHLFRAGPQELGRRMMTDLDILVPRSRTPDALQAIRDLGYRSEAADELKYIHHHHLAPLFRPGCHAVVELHQELMFRTASRFLPTALGWAHSQALYRDDLRFRTLGPTLSVLHNILHSEIVDRYHPAAAINLRGLHDLLALCHTGPIPIDWGALERIMEGHGLGGVLQGYLRLAQGLFQLPPPISPGPRGRLHYARCLGRLRWAGYDRLQRRLFRFAGPSIEKRYRGSGGGWWLLGKRARLAAHLLRRRMLGPISPGTGVARS
jgi:hypothetical protein